MVNLKISYTSIATFLQCPRKWMLHYQIRLRSTPKTTPRPPAFGTAFHRAQESVWRGEEFAANLEAWQAASTALTLDDQVLGEILLQGYRAWWYEDNTDYVVKLAAEERIELRPRDIDGNEIPDVLLQGILDAIALDPDGVTVPVEHKTTMSDISEGAPYWNRLTVNAQAGLYLLLCDWAHRPADYVLWDVVRCPPYRRFLATEPTKRQYRKDGSLYNRQRSSDETLDEFRTRVTAKVLENPAEFFQRRRLYSTPAQRAAAHVDLLDAISLMRHALETEAYPRNAQSCFDDGGHHSQCTYLPLCSGAADVADTRLWEIR